MRNLFLAAVSLLVQIGIWFALGSLLVRILKLKEDAVKELIFGYLLYFALFELLAVPMTLAWAPLSLLAGIWGLFLGVLVLLSVIWNGKRWLQRIKTIPALIREHSWDFVLACAAIGATCLYAALYTGNTHDAAYYVGATSTAVYTDTLWRYHPYTGLPVTNFNTRYIFSAYPMHNAVWCRILGLPALIQTKVVMAALNVLMANLLIYLTGKRMFGKKKRPAVLMLAFWALFQMFTYTQYTQGAFLLTRGYEGKALLANISIPAVLYIAVWLWQETKEKRLWVILFLTSLSALGFSGSSIIFPAVLAAAIVPVMVFRRRFQGLLYLGICMLPTIVYAGVYFSVKAGFFVLPAW